jgi:NAD+ synthase (glutamine-hydrolysing)
MKSKSLRISLAQINPVVGDLPGNVKKIVSYIRRAEKLSADIVAFPELAVTGYPPEDLLLKPQFVRENIEALDSIIAASRSAVVIAGFVESSGGLFNAAAIISKGKLVDVYRKKHLPNYGVFDEYRYFKPGNRYPVYSLGGIKFGVNICEDIWHEDGPAKVQALSGAEFIININASPYHMGKATFREDMILKRFEECGVPIAYLNMVGGQDELVFDGGSFVVDSRGGILARGVQFKEELITVDIEISGRGEKVLSSAKRRELKKIISKGESVDKVKIPSMHQRTRKPVISIKKRVRMPAIEKVYNALLLGTKDYVRKNGFKGVVIGMSGGVDSALVATIAVDSIGREGVHGIFMPSAFTSVESYEDASGHTENLGIKMITIPINNIYDTYMATLSDYFRGIRDVTEENLQARIRGNILMAFSNKFGWLVLTTGNKSEMSVGYATLYGDMAGGFAVIKDVPKTMVYELCQWRNEKEKSKLIPERILWKEPSAELKPDQKDTDTLPPYPVLDPILKAYVEEDKSFDDIMQMGCELECARKIVKMVDLSEYKRRQSPPGIKITPRAFGKDRRFPITNRYRSY